jgi:hypothetical protein
MGKASGKKRTRRRVVKMPEELRQGLADQLERFRKKFSREPGPDDPVFFDPEAGRGSMERQGSCGMGIRGRRVPLSNLETTFLKAAKP